jgi:putative iron-only hydrogenase system regulator
MDNRIAMVSIIVENGDSVVRLNEVLHEFSEDIVGRMGIPYRQRGLNIICIAVDAPQDVISTLSGQIGNLPGVSAKTAYAAARGGA